MSRNEAFLITAVSTMLIIFCVAVMLWSSESRKADRFAAYIAEDVCGEGRGCYITLSDSGMHIQCRGADGECLAPREGDDVVWRGE